MRFFLPTQPRTPPSLCKKSKCLQISAFPTLQENSSLYPSFPIMLRYRRNEEETESPDRLDARFTIHVRIVSESEY